MTNRQICLTDNKTRESYPFDETIILWSEGGETIDSEAPLIRKLVPQTSVEVLTNRNEIFIQSIEFAGYDTSASMLEKAEDEAKEYANEYIRGNMLTASWQPNYFRPVVRVMGRNLASNISNPYRDGDLSIGLPLPFCLNINKRITDITQFEIDIRVALAQQYKGAYRNYPVLAILTFWHNNK